MAPRGTAKKKAASTNSKPLPKAIAELNAVSDDEAVPLAQKEDAKNAAEAAARGSRKRELKKT